MTDEQLTLFSTVGMSITNVHFVVHEDAELVMEARMGITLRRHEVCACTVGGCPLVPVK